MEASISIIGHLGRDPEMRYLPDGTPVTTLSVAANRKYKDKQTTLWFRVSVFGKQAEACNQYLKKGRMVRVLGDLQADADTGGPRLYTKSDGTVGTSFEVRAEKVLFLSPKDDKHDKPDAEPGEFDF